MEYLKHKFRSKSPFEIAFTVLFIAVAIVAFAALFGFIIMWLWNHLMPEIFDLPILSYWQAVGLLILAKLLFGGFGNGHKSSPKKNNWKYKKEDKTFSKWELYDRFWKEEGEAAYAEYVKRNNGNGADDSSSTDTTESEGEE
ncbi:MAG: hypothetical protein N4A46_02310 [Schleiferiaceae bacterium]|jgi:Flp pilus assembly pilin Flp|nr:hypothetical protein [Schleiferiaceae bacterium]